MLDRVRCCTCVVHIHVCATHTCSVRMDVCCVQSVYISFADARINVQCVSYTQPFTSSMCFAHVLCRHACLAYTNFTCRKNSKKELLLPKENIFERFLSNSKAAFLVREKSSPISVMENSTLNAPISSLRISRCFIKNNSPSSLVY